MPASVFAGGGPGGVLEERNVRHMFARMLERAAASDSDSRPATHVRDPADSARRDIVYVKEQLGHGSIQITVDTYGHLIPGANRGAVDRLDDARRNHPQPRRNRRCDDLDVRTVISSLEKVVSRDGIEPSTRRLRVCCSAN